MAIKIVRKIKSMSWDEISTILQIFGGAVLGLSFFVGIAIIWSSIRANREKSETTRQQKVRIAKLNNETASLKTEAEIAKTERADADKEIAIAKADAAKANEETAKLHLTVEEESRKRVEAER